MRFVEPLDLVAGPAGQALLEAGLGREVVAGAATTACRLIEPGAATRIVPAPDLPPGWSWPPPPPPFAGLHPRAGHGPLIMAIVNVTPDSFSGDGVSPEAAIVQAESQLVAGADILDIGGESTRPGAAPVTPAEEQRRILPVVRALAGRATLSVDTRHASTMAAALAAGARIVNDVTGLRHDPESLPLVREAGCPVVLMHMPGTDPQTMQAQARYDDVVLEVARHLADRLSLLGLPPGQVALDPGIGFGKTLEHNLALLARLPLFATLGAPLLIGLSRKRFLGTLAGIPEAGHRQLPSVAGALYAAARGAAVLRVHDVAETVQALRIWQSASQGIHA